MSIWYAFQKHLCGLSLLLSLFICSNVPTELKVVVNKTGIDTEILLWGGETCGR